MFGLQLPQNSAAIIGVSDTESVLKACEQAVRERGERITKLNLSGHGNALGAGFSFKKGGLDLSDLGDFQKQRLQYVLAPNAKINLFVCDAADTEQARTRLQSTADQLNVCISGKDGNCLAGPDLYMPWRLVDGAARKLVGWFMKTGTKGWQTFKPKNSVPADCHEKGPEVRGVFTSEQTLESLPK